MFAFLQQYANKTAKLGLIITDSADNDIYFKYG